MAKMKSVPQKEILDKPFWSMSVDETLEVLGSSRSGLINDEISKRKRKFGENEIKGKTRLSKTRLFMKASCNPPNTL